MPSTICPQPRNQDSLSLLNRVLHLAMHTAEAASAEANHRIVLQAIREVVRIITLINKMAFSSDQEPKTRIKKAPVPAKTSPLPTKNSKIATASADLGQDLFKEIFPSLVQPQATQPKTENQKLETENRLLTKWEKSGKLPKKKRLLKKYHKENQQNNRCQENDVQRAPESTSCQTGSTEPDRGPGNPALSIRWQDDPVTLAAAGTATDHDSVILHP